MRRYFSVLVWIFVWITIGLFLLGLLGSMRHYNGISQGGMQHVHARQSN